MRWRVSWLGLFFAGLLSAAVPVSSAESSKSSSEPGPLEVFDARYLRNLNLAIPEQAAEVWDSMDTIAALQGLANRRKPRLYLLYCSEYGIETDQFWFDWSRGAGGWLQGKNPHRLSSLEEAIRIFRALVRGLVVYDPQVPATACAAWTAAGCEDLLPVRFSRETNSVFRLLTQKLGLPVSLWLVNPDGTSRFTGKGEIPELHQPSSGSSKADVYLWAIHRFVNSGECDPRFAAYYLDAYWLKAPRQARADLHCLPNHDYFIAHRAFFFDLDSWGDETPVDDPNQPLGLDRKIFLQMLASLSAAAPNQMLKIGGFTPWAYKYTDFRGAGGKHGGVPTEWEFARIISQFNGYMEADAIGLGAMANGSFFQHFPLQPKCRQPNRKPTESDWERAGYLDGKGKVASKLYVGFYVGDYDSPAWLYKAVPAFFSHRGQGTVPLGWAFDPNLGDRAPQAMVYAYGHATTNDFFIAGDSGAGYLNPRALTVRPDSKLPPALRQWTEHCARYYARWDMTLTGFMLDGAGGASTPEEFSAYRTFSPDGCGNHFDLTPREISGIPTIREWDMPDSPQGTADFIQGKARAASEGPSFLWARTILKSPSWHEEVAKVLKANFPDAPVAIVDPYTFFGLIRAQVEYGKRREK